MYQELCTSDVHEYCSDLMKLTDITLAVLPEGPIAIAGKELGGEYYQNAAPVLEQQVARAGFRLAGWLDAIAKKAAVDAADEL